MVRDKSGSIQLGAWILEMRMKKRGTSFSWTEVRCAFHRDLEGGEGSRGQVGALRKRGASEACGP